MMEYIAGGAILALTTGMSLGAGVLMGRTWSGAKYNADFEGFIQHINEGYYRSSLEGKQMFGNEALVRLNGYDNEEEFLTSVNDIATEWYVDPDRRDHFKHLLEENGFVENFVSEIYRHKTRERIWISENARLVCDGAGRPLYYEGTIREHTETVKRLELEELHTRLTEQVPGVLFQARTSASNKLTIPYISSGFEQLGGVVSQDPKENAKSLLSRIHPEDLEEFAAATERAARKQAPLVHEFRLLASNEQETWIEVNAAPEAQEDGSFLWHGFLRDITEKKSTESRIHSLAFYDPLTQLPNRRLLMDRIKTTLKKITAQQGNAALLFIDLDDFKSSNDTRVHGFGDNLLLEVTKRLRTCISDEGAVGRIGGDEFLVLMDDLGSDDRVAAQTAEDLARRIVDTIDAPCTVEGEGYHPTCSIGITMIDGQINHVFQAMKQADNAMYMAKDAGKNCYRFHDPKMQEELDSSVSLMTDFCKAIGTDQLALHYQMQVDGENRVVGAEALLRWTHPTKGPVPPAQFVPFAEQNGAILLLTDWLLKEAFRTLERWADNPVLCGVRLSVNISAQQFHQQSFVEQIKALIEAHNIRPELLVLEMTEHVLTGDLRGVKSVMRSLKDLGVSFSLDDFGTGYASLTHTRDLPFDELKIDGKFVRDLDTNESDKTIVRSIIAMAQALGISVVAEWVETDAHREFLVQEGCDALQGYLFGSAVSLKVFEDTAMLPLVNKMPHEEPVDVRFAATG